MPLCLSGPRTANNAQHVPLLPLLPSIYQRVLLFPNAVRQTTQVNVTLPTQSICTALKSYEAKNIEYITIVHFWPQSRDIENSPSVERCQHSDRSKSHVTRMTLPTVSTTILPYAVPSRVPSSRARTTRSELFSAGSAHSGFPHILVVKTTEDRLYCAQRT